METLDRDSFTSQVLDAARLMQWRVPQIAVKAGLPDSVVRTFLNGTTRYKLEIGLAICRAVGLPDELAHRTCPPRRSQKQ